MTTKMIFNTDKKLKEAAMRKARKEGITYSAFLNIATRAYVRNELEIGAFEKELEQARDEMRQGKGISAEELYAKLGIKK